MVLDSSLCVAGPTMTSHNDQQISSTQRLSVCVNSYSDQGIRGVLKLAEQ